MLVKGQERDEQEVRRAQKRSKSTDGEGMRKQGKQMTNRNRIRDRKKRQEKGLQCHRKSGGSCLCERLLLKGI